MLYRPFLSTLFPGTAGELLKGRPERTFRRGECILRQGENGTEVFIIRAGWAAVIRHTPNDEEAILAIRGDGDVVGELAAIDGRPRSATVRALSDAGAVVVPGPEFLALMSTAPEISRTMFQHLADRQRDADTKHAEHATMDALPRVAARLLELADRYGTPTEDGLVDLMLPLGHEDLGRLAGVRRRQIARVVRLLKEPDIVRTPARGRITVVRLDALHEIVTGSEPPNAP